MHACCITHLAEPVLLLCAIMGLHEGYVRHWQPAWHSYWQRISLHHKTTQMTTALKSLHPWW